MKKSPVCSVPFCTSTVATGPRPRSTRDSSTVPLAGASGLAFSSRRSATSRIISSSLVRLVFCSRGDFDHDRVAAPLFRHQAAIGQLPLDALGLRFGLVDLVDGHDDGNAGGLGVVDGFERLRHHAVVGGHHQHDDVGDLGAARAHARERFVARRIDEHDAAAVHRHRRRADVLGDAAGLARGDFGFANGVEQAGLAVVHVAHDGDHRRPRVQILRLFFLGDFLNDFVFKRDHRDDAVERFGEAGGRRRVQRLVDAWRRRRDPAIPSALPWRARPAFRPDRGR